MPFTKGGAWLLLTKYWPKLKKRDLTMKSGEPTGLLRYESHSHANVRSVGIVSLLLYSMSGNVQKNGK